MKLKWAWTLCVFIYITHWKVIDMVFYTYIYTKYLRFEVMSASVLPVKAFSVRREILYTIITECT